MPAIPKRRADEIARETEDAEPPPPPAAHVEHAGADPNLLMHHLEHNKALRPGRPMRML